MDRPLYSPSSSFKVSPEDGEEEKGLASGPSTDAIHPGSIKHLGKGKGGFREKRENQVRLGQMQNVIR